MLNLNVDRRRMHSGLPALLLVFSVGCGRSVLEPGPPPTVESQPSATSTPQAATPSVTAAISPPVVTPTPVLQLLSYSSDGSKLYLYDLNAKGEQPVSFAKDYIYCFNISPDGWKILYEPSYDISPSNEFVNLIDFDTGQIRRTPLHVIGSCDYFYWHPSGKAILILGPGKMELFQLSEWAIVATIDYGEGTIVSLPAFSPDGKKLAFIDNQELHIHEVILDAKNQPIAVSQEFTTLVLPLGNRHPEQVQWSPSGSKLAVFTQRPVSSGLPNPIELYVVNLDDGSFAKVADSENLQPGIVSVIPSQKEFAWSPDGTKIAFSAYAFVSVDKNLAFTTRPQIFVAEADGTGVAKIMEEGQVGEVFIWSPDGDKLIYAAGVMVQESVWEYDKVVMSNPDGSGKAILLSQYIHLPFFPPRPGQDMTKAFTFLGTLNCASGWTRLEVDQDAIVTLGPSSRVRTKPERGDNLIVLIPGGTVVRILDGPVCADELIFWRVEGDAIPGGVGWTAEGDGTEYYLAPYAWEIGQWSETTPIPIPSSAPFDSRGQQLIFHNDYMYVFGGWTAEESGLKNVYYAAVNPNGTLAGWVETTSLSGQYDDHVAVKVGNYVYLITGAAGETAVFYAPISPNGSVGAWISTAPLTPSRQNFAATDYGNYLYATGGNSTGTQSFVKYTSANLDGTLNPWADTTPLPEAIEGHTMVAYDGYLYVMAPNSHVYYAVLNADGTVGSWNTTTHLPQAMSRYSSFVYNGFVYILGGGYSSYYTRILENHSLDEWQTTTPLPTLRYGLRTGANGNYIYAMGGYDSATYQTTVYYAPLE